MRNVFLSRTWIRSRTTRPSSSPAHNIVFRPFFCIRVNSFTLFLIIVKTGQASFPQNESTGSKLEMDMHRLYVSHIPPLPSLSYYPPLPFSPRTPRHIQCFPIFLFHLSFFFEPSLLSSTDCTFATLIPETSTVTGTTIGLRPSRTNPASPARTTSSKASSASSTSSSHNHLARL